MSQFVSAGIKSPYCAWKISSETKTMCGVVALIRAAERGRHFSPDPQLKSPPPPKATKALRFS